MEVRRGEWRGAGDLDYWGTLRFSVSWFYLTELKKMADLKVQRELINMWPPQKKRTKKLKRNFKQFLKDLTSWASVTSTWKLIFLVHLFVCLSITKKNIMKFGKKN